MKQEEYLDRLIEKHDCQGNRHLVNNPEITAILAAAERLTLLCEIDVPADFVRRLEGSLRAHITQKSQTPLCLDPKCNKS